MRPALWPRLLPLLAGAAHAAQPAATSGSSTPQAAAEPAATIAPQREPNPATGAATAPTPAGSTAPPFKLFRYDEDYRYLQDPARRAGVLDSLKFTQLGDDPDTHLSIGGEARTRYEYFSHPGFGLRTDSHDDFVAQRLLLHADFHAGPRDGLHGRAFIQLISATVFGEELPKAANQENPADLQQAFFDLGLGDVMKAAPDGAYRLRVGRQEMGYGSFRLVTTRDATSQRLAFDGVRGTVKMSNVSIDAFITRPVQSEDDVIDDGQDDNTTFWGLYATIPLLPAASLNLDAYYLGLARDNTRFEPGLRDEVRHTFGTRLWGRKSGWDYDLEAVAQAGSFDTGAQDLDIFAWTIASNTGYTFEKAAWKPRIGLKVNVASGDDDPNDGTLGTFNPLFPRNNYFSDATLLAPYNFFDIHPSLQLKPTAALTLTLAWDAFFRYSTDDAVFSPVGILVPAGASDSRFVGSSLSAQVEWSINRHLSLNATYVRFFAGDAIDDAGGEDVDFVGTWFTARF